MNSRRNFIKELGTLTVSAGLFPAIPFDLLATEKKEIYQLALAQWSVRKALFGGSLTNMDFPLMAKKEFGFNIVEYVSPFFKKQETDMAYLKELKNRTDQEGIQNHLIMIDAEGHLGDLDANARLKAVENHYKWIDAAKVLGCKSIRVNAAGKGTEQEVKDAAVQGLGQLAAYGEKNKINVIVENHGGYSSNGKWLAAVMKQVNNPFCGTLPDWGNFKLSADKEYDRYLGIKEMTPFAKGMSAKSYVFDEKGNEINIDFERIYKILKAQKWSGIIGIEYEGTSLSPDEGIRKTKALLERVFLNS